MGMQRFIGEVGSDMAVKGRWGVVVGYLIVAACSDGSGVVDGRVVARVEVSPAAQNVEVGDTLRLSAAARDGSGDLITGVPVAWASADTTKATVSVSGLVTGRAPGLVQITASAGGKTGSANVQVIVTEVVAPVIARLEPSSIQAGWADFTLVVKGSGFTPFARVRFGTFAVETVRVSETELRATVRAIDVGAERDVPVVVETTHPDAHTSAPAMFRVHAKPAHTVELLVSGDALFVQNNLRLEAYAADQFGEVIEGKRITWESSDPTVARIEGANLRGLRPGTVTLTAHAYPVSRSRLVTVLEAPADDIVYQGPSVYGGTELFVRPLAPGSGLDRILPFGTFALEPAPSPDGKRIAFVGRDGEGNLDIYVVNRDGTGLRRLTHDAAIDNQPAWSPDGRSIAFRSLRSGKSDIWVMGETGADPRNLTHAEVWLPEEMNLNPAWSPDSRTIVFSRTVGIGAFLATVPAAGGQIRPLVEAGGATLDHPSWSHDGQVIAYQRRETTGAPTTIAFAHAATGTPIYYMVALPPSAQTPQWQRDGWLAITARGLGGHVSPTVVLVNLSSGRIVAPLGAEHGALLNPAWIAR